MSASRISLFAIALASLSACATSDCDPGQGGFVRGIGCSADGKYEVRQEEKQQTLSTEQQRSEELESTYQGTRAEQERVRQERQAAERKYAALQDDLDALRNKLAAAKVQNRDLENDIAALESEIALLKNDAFTPQAEKQQRLDRLQRQKDLLEQEVDAAIKL